MSVAPPAPKTLTAFLDWEERQELKYEFDGFQPLAMTGGNVEYATIQVNLITALKTRLHGGPCRALGSEMKILVAGSIRYPDALVVCSPIPPGSHFTDKPVVVFEIVSPSSATIDHVDKNREYRDTPSVLRYVILEQSRVAATVFLRDDGGWSGRLVPGDKNLELPEIGVTIPMAELYEDVVFPPDAGGG